MTSLCVMALWSKGLDGLSCGLLCRNGVTMFKFIKLKASILP
jgi:hypothetical protein